MKFRIGFVANSSSSAFVLIVPVDVHEKVLEGLHPYVRFVTERIGKVQDVLGKQCFVTGELVGMDGSLTDWEGIEYEYQGKPMKSSWKGIKYEVNVREAWNEFYQESLPKDSYFKWQIAG